MCILGFCAVASFVCFMFVSSFGCGGFCVYSGTVRTCVCGCVCVCVHAFVSVLAFVSVIFGSPCSCSVLRLLSTKHQ